jgi:hypothetical protein
MNTLASFVAAFVLGGLQRGARAGPWAAGPALQNRIPAPQPPPAQPPIINGPLSHSPPPGVYTPRRLNTFSDRATSCLHEGSSYGLRGRKLDAYTRACAKPVVSRQ